jgi:hypothetical protein
MGKSSEQPAVWVRCLVVATFLWPSTIAGFRCQADDLPIKDVTVRWAPWHGTHPEIKFFVNGELVGADRDGMQAVLEMERKLPRRTSIVWGPDTRKMGGGPPGGPNVVRAFPEEWAQFKAIAQENGLILSSSPAPGRAWPSLNEVTSVVAASGPRGPDDIVVSWYCPYGEGIELTPFGKDTAGVLALKRHLETQPAGRTVRFVLDREGPKGSRFFSWEKGAVSQYDGTLARVIQARGLRSVVEMPAEYVWPWDTAAHRATIRWRRFNAEQATPEEFVYLANGKYVGTGDRGFDALLKFIQEQPAGSVVGIPAYTRLEQKLDDDLPFQSRRAEFDAQLKSRSIVLDYLDDARERGVLETLVNLGTIVRDGRRPRNADATLSWSSFDPTQRRGDASQAVFTVNRVETGRGIKGFLAAIEKIEALPNRAVVRLDPVCINTTGPFPLPVVLPGQRHFARTGHEPYEPLVDVLGEIVERKKLVVELIPDQAKALTDGIPK